MADFRKKMRVTDGGKGREGGSRSSRSTSLGFGQCGHALNTNPPICCSHCRTDRPPVVTLQFGLFVSVWANGMSREAELSASRAPWGKSAASSAALAPQEELGSTCRHDPFGTGILSADLGPRANGGLMVYMNMYSIYLECLG